MTDYYDAFPYKELVTLVTPTHKLKERQRAVQKETDIENRTILLPYQIVIRLGLKYAIIWKTYNDASD